MVIATKACRPFDVNRCGMVLGEGAGAVVLETLESAQARGATIFGEVTGYGSSLVCRDGVADFEKAFHNAILGCLETAAIEPEDIGHVHAHGLSSPTVDRCEASAINGLLGKVPVTAAKSYMGNLGAGSGMVELIASVLAMQNGELFPILNCDSPDVDCPINTVSDWIEPGEICLNLNCTPQGQASAVVVRKVSR